MLHCGVYGGARGWVAAGGRNAGAGGEDGSDEKVGGRGAIALREAQKRLASLVKGVELAAGGDLAGPTV